MYGQNQLMQFEQSSLEEREPNVNLQMRIIPKELIECIIAVASTTKYTTTVNIYMLVSSRGDHPD